MKQLFKNLMNDESGQDLIEYALIAALIAVTCVAVLGTIGTKVNSEFTKVSAQLT
jgi:pilus assembly protein Flp/PilA